MENKYKIIISNRNLYREVELPVEAKNFRVGTSVTCDYRLHKDLFFEDIRLDFINNVGKWSVMCADNVYISVGDTRRLLTAELHHGDCIYIKYQESNNDVFTIDFMVDFDCKKRNFERKINVDNLDRISIGAGSENSIVILSEYILNDKIELVKKGQDLVLNIIYVSYGVYHNGNKAKNQEIIKDGDFISISDFMFYYKNHALWTENAKNCAIKNLSYIDVPIKEDYPMFIRNTRIKYNFPKEKIGLLVPPPQPQKPQQNLAMTLLPALAMLALTIVVRGFMSSSSNNTFIIFSVCSMSIGIVTSIASFFSSKKKYKTECKERVRQYNEYIDRKKSEISVCREKERELFDIIYRNTAEDIEAVNGFKAELFDRLKEDEDFLCVYIGRGKVRSHREISYKKAESFETDDSLAELPEKITKQYEMIEDCPIVVNLQKSSAIGVIGLEQNNYEFMKIMITDVVCRHYYSEVNLYLLIDGEEKFCWAKRLPHLKNQANTRNIVYDAKSRNNIFEALYKELTIRSTQKSCEGLTYLVIFVWEEWGLKTHPLSQFIENADSLKACFVFFEENRNEIPLYCSEIIELYDESHGVKIDAEDGEQVSQFIYEAVSEGDMNKICAVLQPVYSEEISLESSLRKSIDLFELMNIYVAEDIDLKTNWNTAQVWRSMAAPIGVNAKNEIVYLNLHEKFHGPHGLVAGTTGSGKSEILQTYILSAAVRFHPYEVSFVIIDFKGGGMVNQFKDLPHLIGAITNIDGREIERSLKSIKAELLKRQTLFAKANVNHIDKYIKLYKEKKADTPLPHLIIIVDEFAELKAEQPEFMKELISAARIGRSLGVHLILATQKPSGQVNEQIWSNSKFKLCLKVQNKEDSNEVLKSPLAAEIREPGRAYLQVGNNEIFELFQSGFSGALEKASDTNEKEYIISEVDFGGHRKELYRKKKTKNTEGSRTQLEALVEYINKFCVKEAIMKLPNICLPPLSEVIPIDQPEGSSGENLPVGIYDDPDSQYQGQANINIMDENYMIIGSSATGKTNFLQVVIRQIASFYTPGQANIYIMDFGAMYLKIFEALNHVGGVVTISDEEKLKNLFKMLTEEIQTRKDEFVRIGLSSFHSYIDSGYEDMPHIFVLLDNFTAFKEIYGDDYEEQFLYIIREGLACGIHVILTNALTSGLGYKYMSNFAGKLALHCNDSSEYSTLFERCRMQPKEIPGRALCKIKKELFEMQIYLAFEGAKEKERSDAAKQFMSETNEQYGQSRAKRIPEIPERLTLSYIEDNFKFDKNKYSYPLALDYSEVDVVEIDFEKVNELCIVGNDEMLRIHSVASIIQTVETYILEKDVTIYIIDNVYRKLKYLSEKVFVEEYTVDFSKIETIITDLEEKLEERYEYLVNDESGKPLKMPLNLVVINSKEAIEYISTNKDILQKYNKIIRQYKTLGIGFLYSDLEDVAVPYGAPELMKHLKENKKAIITTQKLKDFKFCEIPSTIVRNMKPLSSGDAYLLNGTDVNRMKLMEVKQNG